MKQKEGFMRRIPQAWAATFEEFCFLVKEDQKADLIDGVIYIASPESLAENELFGWLLCLFGCFIEEGDLGQLYGSRVAFRLGETQAPEPDLGFVRRDRLHLKRRNYIDGPPDLAVEIVAPDSIERDYRKKREQYRKARVPEYWIVDPMKQRVILLQLTKTRAYREVRPRKGVLRSHVLPGFWLRPAWLWQDPLPLQTTVLAEIRGQ
jgi:Uma2 family endonuclease